MEFTFNEKPIKEKEKSLHTWFNSGHQSFSVLSLTVLPESGYVGVGSNDFRVESLSEENKSCLTMYRVSPPESELFFFFRKTVALSDTLLAACNDNNVIKLYDLKKKELSDSMKGHTTYISHLFRWTEKEMMSTAMDGSVILWDVEKMQKVRKYDKHTKACTHGKVLHDNKTFVTVSSDKTVRLWDIRDGTSSGMFKVDNKFSLERVEVYDEYRLYIGGYDNFISELDIRTGKVVRKLEGHTGPISALRKMHNEYLASASHDRSVIIWELSTGVIESKEYLHSDKINDMIVIDNRNYMTCSNDGHFKVSYHSSMVEHNERVEFIEETLEKRKDFEIVLPNNERVATYKSLLGNSELDLTDKKEITIKSEVDKKKLSTLLLGRYKILLKDVDEKSDPYKALEELKVKPMPDDNRKALKMELYKTRKYSNLVLVTPDKGKFRVHKEILIMSQKFFHLMFRFPGVESTGNEVNIESQFLTKSVMECLIEYIYTGDIKTDNTEILMTLFLHSLMYFETNLSLLITKKVFRFLQEGDILENLKKLAIFLAEDEVLNLFYRSLINIMKTQKLSENYDRIIQREIQKAICEREFSRKEKEYKQEIQLLKEEVKKLKEK